MKKFFLLSVTLFLGLMITSKLSAQNSGDYRSVTSGNYTDASTWETFDGANWIAAISAPGSSTVGLITIQTGDTLVIPDGKTGNAYDLMIETGAILNGGEGVTIASPRSLRIHGTTVTVNGVLGDPSGGTINLEFNNDITITGTVFFLHHVSSI